jgi:hypothetical protein
MTKITKLEFAAMVIHLCALYQCSVTSWIRTQERNRKVGGHQKSTHLVGFGADLVPDDMDAKPALVAAARLLGLDAVDESHHVHIEVDSTKQA